MFSVIKLGNIERDRIDRLFSLSRVNRQPRGKEPEVDFIYITVVVVGFEGLMAFQISSYPLVANFWFYSHVESHLSFRWNFD